jgi:cytochrome c-type biogenesis protein CcmH/NrfG
MNRKLTIVTALLSCLSLTACVTPGSRSAAAQDKALQTEQQKQAEQIAAQRRRTEQMFAAELAYAANQWANAEASYRTLIVEDPDNELTWFRLGTIFLRTNRPQLAVQAYDRAVQCGADDVRLWQNKAIAHAMLASTAANEARRRSNDRKERGSLDRFARTLDAMVPRELQPAVPRAAVGAARGAR